MEPVADIVVLDRGHNTSCAVNLHGATVVSWRVNYQEQLFVSKAAVFNSKKAIRGGIPFIFPVYGDWTVGPRLGFAHVVQWKVEKEPERLPEGDIEATFSLVDNDYTRMMWNFAFRITYTLLLSDNELQFNITIDNPSKDTTLPFQLLLHSYIKVPDMRLCQITGLQNCMYIDKVAHPDNSYHDVRDAVTIQDRIESMYQNTQEDLIITNVMSDKKMCIKKKKLPDTVIWNPGETLSKDMVDFEEDEYLRMICIELGCATNAVMLPPRTTFEASQTLQIMEEESDTEAETETEKPNNAVKRRRFIPKVQKPKVQYKIFDVKT